MLNEISSGGQSYFVPPEITSDPRNRQSSLSARPPFKHQNALDYYVFAQ
jgi:hypothetical protein